MVDMSIRNLESVVESMASVVGYVFGAHRQLDQRNATKELVIRWNGPKTTKADAVVEAAVHKLQKRFCAQSEGSRLRNMVGSVIWELGFQPRRSHQECHSGHQRM